MEQGETYPLGPAQPHTLCNPQACTTSHSVPPRPAQPQTLCLPLPTSAASHLSIHPMPFADFEQRFHGLQGSHIPLVDVLGGHPKEEVPQVLDQGLRVPLWVELPGEGTVTAAATPRAAGKTVLQQAGGSPELPHPICA